MADSHGLPVGLSIESASPREVKLVVSTLVEMVVAEAPRIWSATMRTILTNWTPNSGAIRLAAKLVVRYERYANNFLGMLHLGCCLILIRHL